MLLLLVMPVLASKERDTQAPASYLIGKVRSHQNEWDVDGAALEEQLQNNSRDTRSE